MRKVFGYIMLALEIIVCTAALVIGLFDVKVSFMENTRMVVVVLGVVGMVFCIYGVVRFIKHAPANIFSILGYILGLVGLGIFFIQLFTIDVPFLGNPKWALVSLCAVIILKGIIGRTDPWIKKENEKKAAGQPDDVL